MRLERMLEEMKHKSRSLVALCLRSGLLGMTVVNIGVCSVARTLNANIQAALAAGNHAARHLLSFTASGTNYYFAEDQVQFQGNTYAPHLVLDSAIRLTEHLRAEPVMVRLQNIDLQTAKVLDIERSDMQGIEATIQRLFPAANEAVILFRGRIGEIRVDERTASLRLEGDLDPTATEIPRRKYSNLCAWDFKDANCGYEDGTDPDDPGTGQPFLACPKDFLSCQARGRQHRFPGFLHITRALTESVEGQSRSRDAERRLSEALLP